MRVAIDKENQLLFTTYFPKKFYSDKKRFEAIIGVGANIPNESRRFKKLVQYLIKDKKLSLHSTSPLFINPPFGYLEQSSFYNSALYISTNLYPKALLRYLLQIEKYFGRVRTFKDAPRKLDLDIIFYENINFKDKKLEIPHGSFYKRESVLIPLVFLDVK